MTEIGRSVFELCERKEIGQSVGLSGTYIIQNRASIGLVVNHCAMVMSQKMTHGQSAASLAIAIVGITDSIRRILVRPIQTNLTGYPGN